MGNSTSKNRPPWASYGPNPAYGPNPGYGAGAPGFYPPAGFQPQFPIPQHMQPGMPQMPVMMVPQAQQSSSRRRSNRSSRHRSTRSRRGSVETNTFAPPPTVNEGPVIPGINMNDPSSNSRRTITRSVSESRPRMNQTPYPGGLNPMLEDPGAAEGRDNGFYDMVHPLPAPNPEVFGPQDGAVIPSNPRNPLPPPPQDIYELSPYKHILNLPSTGDLLLHRSGSGSLPRRRSTKKRGFFKTLFNPQPEEIPQTEVKFVPVPVNSNGRMDPGFMSSQPIARQRSSSSPGIPEESQPAWAMPRGVGSNYASSGANIVPPPGTVNIGGASVIPSQDMSSLRKVMFNQDGPYPGFLNHSNFRVMYHNQTYPTATNLHEALKFLPGRPDLAESIRNIDVAQVYDLSADFERRYGISADWHERFQSDMDTVLQLKFAQHPNLRMDLLNTEDAELVYADPQDEYWGSGNGMGMNELGKALMRVRQYLREHPNGR